ncbi:MAG: T9SS type A sorting domain-containing protein, partial [Phaeodactylibacter sp.]|nr:T9SS type A sorting domain-containing protein [Phaeodactylibacter sp.]
LLETPVIDVHVASGGGGGVTLTRKTYTLSQQIKYAINTTGGLAENPKSVVAAIYFKGCPMEAVPAGSNLVGNGLIVAEDDGTWRTPFLPLDCLLDYEVGFQEAIASNIVTNMCEGEVTLKVVMAIERAASVGGGDDIMYMATYYTAQNIIPHPDILTMPLPSNPFGEMDLFEIEEDPSSLGCAFVPPTDPSAFCESKYDPAPLDDGLSEKSLESQIGNLDINMYPNPVNNYLVVVNLEGPVQITITDMTGRTWKQVETADLEYKFNVSELPSGMYTVTIRTQSGLLQGSELLFKE